MINVLVDTGFWFALYTDDDEHHARAQEIMDNSIGWRFLIPFPTLYETINTKFVKRNMNLFKVHLTNIQYFLVHDESYKHLALQHTLDIATDSTRSLSLVDTVLRLMLADPNLDIKGLITFNPGDFADICYPKNITLYT